MTSVVPEFTRHFHTQLNSLPMIQFCAVASRQQCLFHILSDYLQTTIFYMHKGKSWESTSGNICLIFPNLYCFLSSALSTLFNIFQHPSIKVIICKLCSSHINLPTRWCQWEQEGLTTAGVGGGILLETRYLMLYNMWLLNFLERLHLELYAIRRAVNWSQFCFDQKWLWQFSIFSFSCPLFSLLSLMCQPWEKR